MPRDAARIAEWQTTTRMTAEELRKLPERYPVAATPEVKKSVKQQAAAASVQGKLIDRELFQQYLPLAQRFVPEPQLVSKRARLWANAEDVAIFLVLLEFFGKNPNEDGSMPQKRFAGLWDKLYQDGEVSRSFDNKRFKWIRNRVSDQGGIEWQDATYCWGRAAKWKASSQLQALMDGYAGRGVELETSGGLQLTVDTNHQRKVSGSNPAELDAIWLKMPVENGQNVGLCPVMVAVDAGKWTLADHLDGLEVMGLGWMAV